MSNTPGKPDSASRRPTPATLGLVILLVVGGLVLATALGLNFLTHELNIVLLVIGVALIAAAIVGLMLKELRP